MTWFERLTPAEKAGLLVVGGVILLLLVGGAIFLSARQPPAAALAPTLTPTNTAVVIVAVVPTETPTPVIVTATPVVVTATASATPIVITATSAPPPPTEPGPAQPTTPPQPPGGRIPQPPGAPPPIVQAPTAPPNQPPPGQPAQPPSAPPTVQLEIQNASSYQDTSNTMHLIGEVINRSTTAAKPVTVTATLYDRGNGVIATAQALPVPLPIAGGARAAFDIAIQNPPAGLDHFGLAASGQPTTEPVHSDLQPVSPSSTVDAATGTVRVSGQIRNPAGEVRRNVVVVAVFYDTAGKVVRVGAAPTNPPDISAGGTASFEVRVPATGVQLQRFDLLTGAQ